MKLNKLTLFTALTATLALGSVAFAQSSTGSDTTGANSPNVNAPSSNTPSSNTTGSNTTTSNTTTSGVTTSGTPTMQKLNDAQIAAVLMQANTGEIDEARVVRDKATNPEVKRFAELMIKDHTKADKKVSRLSHKLKLKPEQSSLSAQLRDSGKQSLTQLKSQKSGADFDRAYIDQAVTDHRLVLDTIDQQLLPNAEHAQLKALLRETRPVIQSHLMHAERIQTMLGKRGVASQGQDMNQSPDQMQNQNQNPNQNQMQNQMQNQPGQQNSNPAAPGSSQ